MDAGQQFDPKIYVQKHSGNRGMRIDAHTDQTVHPEGTEVHDLAFWKRSSHVAKAPHVEDEGVTIRISAPGFRTLYPDDSDEDFDFVRRINKISPRHILARAGVKVPGYELPEEGFIQKRFRPPTVVGLDSTGPRAGRLSPSLLGLANTLSRKHYGMSLSPQRAQEDNELSSQSARIVERLTREHNFADEREPNDFMSNYAMTHVVGQANSTDEDNPISAGDERYTIPLEEGLKTGREEARRVLRGKK
jgi:hypothetical protein